MNDAGHLNESRIQLAYLYSSAGIYLEAANMLKLVDTTALDRRQLVDYYIARHKLNDELQLYSHDSAQGHESWRLTESSARRSVPATTRRPWRFPNGCAAPCNPFRANTPRRRTCAPSWRT